MLHENKDLKTLIIRKIQLRLNNVAEVTKSREFYFDEKVEEKYLGIKLHHGHPFLFEGFNQLTYLRGISGKTILDTFLKINQKRIYSIHQKNGLTYRVREKSNGKL